MKIEILDVKVENKGKFRMATVTYKGPEGKPDAKKIPSFKNKEVFTVLADAKLGDIFEVKSEKSAEGYWEWTAINSEGKNVGGETSQTTAKASQAARSNFETPEERARRQVYIIRQSSIASAVELLKDRKVSTDDVLKTAKEFEAYVTATEAVSEAVVN